MKNKGKPMKHLEKTMKKHVFGPPKGSLLGPPDSPRANWTKKNKNDKSCDLSFFLSAPKNDKSPDLSFFFGRPQKIKTTNHMICRFFLGPFCLWGVWGPKRAPFGRPKNRFFFSFHWKIANLEVGSQRE